MCRDDKQQDTGGERLKIETKGLTLKNEKIDCQQFQMETLGSIKKNIINN